MKMEISIKVLEEVIISLDMNDSYLELSKVV